MGGLGKCGVRDFVAGTRAKRDPGQDPASVALACIVFVIVPPLNEGNRANLDPAAFVDPSKNS